MKQRTKQFVFYAVYLAFVMALTTTTIVAISGWRGQCYVMRDKKVEYINCPCPCNPGDRDSSGLFCKRCEHYIDERLANYLPHSDDLPIQSTIPAV